MAGPVSPRPGIADQGQEQRALDMEPVFGLVEHDRVRPIEDVGVAFGIVATELESGREMWLTEGSIIDAVRASLLRDLGRLDAALAADLRALELTANEAERRLLAARTRTR